MAKTTAKQQPQTNAERSEQTRGRLIEAGTKLFARDGYSEVSTEQIVRAAKVTRGALYHHFGDKRDLFRAVFEQQEADALERIAEQVTGIEDPWQIALTGTECFLDICLEPSFQQIAIVDSPSVLGFVEQTEIADRYGGAMVQATLQALMDMGRIEQLPIKSLSRMFTGALISGGLAIAEASDQKAARRDAGEVVRALLTGLATNDA